MQTQVVDMPIVAEGGKEMGALLVQGRIFQE